MYVILGHHKCSAQTDGSIKCWNYYGSSPTHKWWKVPKPNCIVILCWHKMRRKNTQSHQQMSRKVAVKIYHLIPCCYTIIACVRVHVHVHIHTQFATIWIAFLLLEWLLGWIFSMRNWKANFMPRVCHIANITLFARQNDSPGSTSILYEHNVINLIVIKYFKGNLCTRENGRAFNEFL